MLSCCTARVLYSARATILRPQASTICCLGCQGITQCSRVLSLTPGSLPSRRLYNTGRHPAVRAAVPSPVAVSKSHGQSKKQKAQYPSQAVFSHSQTCGNYQGEACKRCYRPCLSRRQQKIGLRHYTRTIVCNQARTALNTASSLAVCQNCLSAIFLFAFALCVEIFLKASTLRVKMSHACNHLMS